VIEQKIKLIPKEPGCYLMKNEDGIIIYIGKAKDLKNRITSYFKGKHTGKTLKLVSEIKDFEYVIVESEIEAFILELNLIKKHSPKYNILLRDDKSYPYIELIANEAPELKIVRNLNRIKKKNSYLFGPYPNVSAARSTVNLLNRMYPLKKCNTYPKKPCLYYHLGQCYGYCFQKVDSSLTTKLVEDVLKFLKGDHSIITSKIKKDMIKESEKMNYEAAKELRELLSYIEITLTKQLVELKDTMDIDLFASYSDDSFLSIQVFFIRNGKIVERHSKIMPLIDLEETLLNRYIATFYDKDVLLPKEILVPNFINASIIEEYLKIPVKIPYKGDKKKLMDMASNNAKITLEKEIELIKKDESKTSDANLELMNILKLNKLDRIEIFDNSNLFGTFNVSGMVVFIDGKPYKNEYRKYKISIDKNDDYGTMKEVIYRRYFRVLKDNLSKPDLIIIDGGLGQINVARDVLSSLNLNIPIVGLKKGKKHTTEALLAFNPIEEINISKNSNLFYYLERMQEEVHNYTISYHKQIRSKGLLESFLDNINGIGKKRKEELLDKYKTINKLKELTKEELELILPETVALELIKKLEEYE
jgi:excinuclease ABC subunit C